MNVFKKIAEAVLWGGFVFLLFIACFEQVMQIPAWLKVAGRMHPMFLHFPIVLLLISFLSAWIPASEQNKLPWLGLFRLFASLSAVITAIMGLLLSLEEDRSGNALLWHKWMGISVAVAGFLFYNFYTYLNKRRNASKTFTVLACVIIIFAGHWGAVLTHGQNYLLAPLAKERKVPVAQAIVFDDIIKPVLENKCFTCHGEDNTKGGLLMTNMDGILRGGKTGPLFLPGDPLGSLLIHRIHLPETDKKHMPPKAKPQLTEEESALLYAWIRSGALLDKKLTTLPVQDSFRMLASRALGAAAEIDQPVYSFTAASDNTIAELNNNFRVLEQLGAGSPALSVHFYGREKYSSKAVEELLPIKQQITELTLARMPVKDNDLAIVCQMPNLRKLNLNYTDVTSKGLEQLSVLKNLQILALSGTAINAASVEKLLSLPQLTAVYAWNTAIDSVWVTAMGKRFRKVSIEMGFKDNEKIMIALSPPVISPTTGIISEPTKVEMKHPFKGVDIRYTLDGSMPDSVTSELYSRPVMINNNIKLMARAFKKGWYGSSETHAAYIKKGYAADSIELLTPLDPKYKNAKTSLLADGDLGETNIGNGQWLGFQINDADFLLYFNNPVTIENVLLNILQNTGSFIFPPVKLEIWGGMDKKKLKLLGKITPEMPKKQEAATLLIEKVSFDATTVKVLKIAAQHLGKLPQWHPGKGKPGWVFVSEIVAN